MIVVWWIIAIGNIVAIVLFAWFDVVIALKLGASPSWFDMAACALIFIGVLRLYPLAKRYDAMGRR